MLLVSWPSIDSQAAPWLPRCYGDGFFLHTIKIPNIITKSIICLGRRAAVAADQSAFHSPAAHTQTHSLNMTIYVIIPVVGRPPFFYYFIPQHIFRRSHHIFFPCPQSTNVKSASQGPVSFICQPDGRWQHSRPCTLYISLSSVPADTAMLLRYSSSRPSDANTCVLLST